MALKLWKPVKINLFFGEFSRDGEARRVAEKDICIEFRKAWGKNSVKQLAHEKGREKTFGATSLRAAKCRATGQDSGSSSQIMCPFFLVACLLHKKGIRRTFFQHFCLLTSEFAWKHTDYIEKGPKVWRMFVFIINSMIKELSKKSMAC